MSNLGLSKAEAPAKMEVKQGTYKVASSTLIVETKDRVEIKSITEDVKDFVGQAGIEHGFVQISLLHTTAGLMVNETQGALLSDITKMFEDVAPTSVYYKHNDPKLSDCPRKNAHAHLRAVLMGNNLTIPVADGKMVLGTWQDILMTEFDGPNNRKLHIQVMGI